MQKIILLQSIGYKKKKIKILTFIYMNRSLSRKILAKKMFIDV